MTDIDGVVPCLYQGVQFRSTLEANWAATLDHYGIVWEYEAEEHVLGSGARYLPDFTLTELATIIEAKGVHLRRIEKTRELAAENPDLIILIGWPPMKRSLQDRLWDPYLQWQDAAGYDTRLAQCPHCGAWQWLRAELSRTCRKCHEQHYGVLAKAGEMPFMHAEPDRPPWMQALRCPG